LPINTVGMNTGRTGLDQFTSGNISTDQTERFWAHLIMDYVFVCESPRGGRNALDDGMSESTDVQSGSCICSGGRWRTGS
jgi:hypothetical protein